MNETSISNDISQKIGYFPFLGPDEKTVYVTTGILDKLIKGYLVLTNKKLFFYFYTNIARDKKFIATHPYIKSVDLKEGLIYSTLKVDTKKETYIIGKINKKSAKEFYNILDNIVKNSNKQIKN